MLVTRDRAFNRLPGPMTREEPAAEILADVDQHLEALREQGLR